MNAEDVAEWTTASSRAESAFVSMQFSSSPYVAQLAEFVDEIGPLVDNLESNASSDESIKHPKYSSGVFLNILLLPPVPFSFLPLPFSDSYPNDLSVLISDVAEAVLKQFSHHWKEGVQQWSAGLFCFSFISFHDLIFIFIFLFHST